MKIFRLAGMGLALVIALLFAVFVGDQGPWYFAWVIGTVMIVLISGAGAVLLDAQEEEHHERGATLMMGDLEAIIFFVPFFYMAIYLVAYVCMKRRLP